MTDPKKNNWNDLAEQIGAAAPQEKTPAPEPSKPVEAATPPPPPKRTQAPAKKSGWGAIASLLGIDSGPAAESTVDEVELPQADAPGAEIPEAAPSEFEAPPEPVAGPDERAGTQPTQSASDGWGDTGSTPDVVSEANVSEANVTEANVTEANVAEANVAEAKANDGDEPTVSSRGSRGSRGRRRRRRPAEESREAPTVPADEPVAESTADQLDRPAADFADDEDPLLLKHDTFVDEIDIAHDDESDSIDNAEVANAAETEEGRPKRRRRRGRRRGRRDSTSTSGADETNGKAAADTVTSDEGCVKEEAGDALQSSDEKKDVDDDATRADEGAPRKRRRGRRRRGAKRDEPNAAEAVAEDRTIESSSEVARDVTPATADELDDDDDDDSIEDEEGGEEPSGTESRHRKIPTWSDAIGGIVDSNLASRSKNPNPPRRGRGGRGRGRQGDRSSS